MHSVLRTERFKIKHTSSTNRSDRDVQFLRERSCRSHESCSQYQRDIISRKKTPDPSATHPRFPQPCAAAELGFYPKLLDKNFQGLLEPPEGLYGNMSLRSILK